MPKKPLIQPNNSKRRALSDKLLSKLKKDFDVGDGLDISIGTYDPETNKSKTSYIFSSKLPILEVTSKTAKRSIKVEVSSVEQDNAELLHTLFSNTKRVK